MASQLISLASWYFLPTFITNITQNVFYTVTIRAGEPKPLPGSPRHVRDQRRIRIGIIVIYLCYTLYAAHHEIQQSVDFYSLLDLPYDAPERVVQSRFRRLTVSYHPDKIAPGADRTEAEALYMQLQLARDTLSDPIKRFAYDRFGPTPFNATYSSNTIPAVRADYILPALRSTAIFYISSAIGLILPVVLGYFKEGTFWRYWALFALLTFEATVAMRPSWPVALTSFVNPVLRLFGAAPVEMGYLPFQLTALLRAWAVSVLVAGAQLSGLLRSAPQAGEAGNGGGGKNGEVTQQMLDRLNALTLAADQEIGRLMGFEISPFVVSAAAEGSGAGQQRALAMPEMTPELRAGLKGWLVQNTIRNDAELKAAIVSALEKRR